MLRADGRVQPRVGRRQARLESLRRRRVAAVGLRLDRVAIESRAIQFENDPGDPGGLTFSVAVSLTPYEAQLFRFR